EPLGLAAADFLVIHRLGHLHIEASTVVWPLAGMFHTRRRAAALHLPATGLALGEVLVALRIGAIDHAAAAHTAVAAGGHFGGVHPVHIYRHPVIKHIAFAFKVLAAGFLAVFDDAAMQLVHIGKTAFEQQGRCLFALDAPGAVGQDLFVFVGLQFGDLF